MSAGSYSRAAKQHLFLLVSPLATVATNGQLDGDGCVFVHETGLVQVRVCVCVNVHACRQKSTRYILSIENRHLFICK